MFLPGSVASCIAGGAEQLLHATSMPVVSFAREAPQHGSMLHWQAMIKCVTRSLFNKFSYCPAELGHLGGLMRHGSFPSWSPTVRTPPGSLTALV